jgi:hypothetical protein
LRAGQERLREMIDDIRPKGTVQVPCSRPGCGWEFWVDALDPGLPDGPFVCPTCELKTCVAKMPDAEVGLLWERLSSLPKDGT